MAINPWYNHCKLNSQLQYSMATIHLTTFIAAPVDVVFDLSRHIGLHKISQQHNKEEAIGGTTSGLIKEGEFVKWKAKHLYKTRFLKIRISKMNPHTFFEDVMEQGDFKSFIHEHHFKSTQNGTIVIDILNFESPFGFVGAVFNKLYLTTYIKRLLEQRNKTIKQYAESNKWKALLNDRTA
jgi:ligand-binding SRPBCC domain-containing protein